MDTSEFGSSYRGDARKVVLARCNGLRYRGPMKRAIPKLAVRRETIRALATQELTRAVGGDATVLGETDTCKVNCTSQAVIKPPAG